MTMSEKTSKPVKNWLGMKPEITSLLQHCIISLLCIWIVIVAIRFEEVFWRRGFSMTCFAPPCIRLFIRSKNNNTCKGQWILHLYQVKSKSNERLRRRSWKYNIRTRFQIIFFREYVSYDGTKIAFMCHSFKRHVFFGIIVKFTMFDMLTSGALSTIKCSRYVNTHDLRITWAWRPRLRALIPVHYTCRIVPLCCPAVVTNTGITCLKQRILK